MMKRFSAVAVAVLMAASASFASWDYFPPLDAGSGQAKLAFEFGIPAEKTTTMALGVGARYSIIQGLEASLWLPIPLSSSFDGNSVDGYAGLSEPSIGVRYWLEFGLGFFVDAYLPVDTRYDEDDLAKVGYKKDFDLHLGVQYATTFVDDALSLGAEVEVTDLVVDADVDLGIGVEVGYSIGIASPFLGLRLGTLLSDADMTFDLTVGSGFTINQMFGAGVDIKLGLTGYGEDNLPITIGANVAFNF